MGRWLFAVVILLVFSPLSTLAQNSQSISFPIKLNNGEREIRAVVFTPNGGKPAPGVLVLHTATATGVHEQEDEDYARALARQGFVAVVPDYVILGKRRWNRGIQAALRQVAQGVAKLPEVAGKPVGIVGFSLGSTGLMASAVTPTIKAVVIYYGAYDPFAVKTELRRPPAGTIVPLDDVVAQGIGAATLLLHGEKDDEVPASQAAQMHEKLKKFGKTSKLVTYPNAYHRFDRGHDGKSKYHYEVDAKARDDAFQRTVAWLKQYLGQ